MLAIVTISYTKDALRTLQRMPVNMATQIRQKIVQYAIDPHSLANNVSMLKGEDRRYRMRVGDWRVIFTDDGQILAILKIAPRSKACD